MIRLCHLEVDWFSQRCPVVALDPDISVEGHTFDDFSRTPELLEKGRAWTERFLRSDQGELLRSFAGDQQASSDHVDPVRE